MSEPAKIEVKKGKRTWRPATQLDVRAKEPGFRYRWVEKDLANVDKKTAEGWELVNSAQGKQGERPDAGNTGMTTLQEYRELALARMPDELAQARNEYFEDETNRRTAALKENVKNDLRRVGGNRLASAVQGKITIIE